MTTDCNHSQKIQMIRNGYALIRQSFGFKTLLVLSAVLVFVFADLAIPLINVVIQLKINLLGFLLERLLQSIFDIPLRQAQVLAAWIYLLIGVVMIWYLFKKIYQVLFDAFYRMRHNWSAKNRLQKMVIFVLIILLFFALAKISLLFV